MPPLLKGMSRGDIIGFIKTPLKTEFLCHNQPIEREVALMAHCTKAVVDWKDDDRKAGQQMAIHVHRQENPCKKRKIRTVNAE